MSEFNFNCIAFSVFSGIFEEVCDEMHLPFDAQQFLHILAAAFHRSKKRIQKK